MRFPRRIRSIGKALQFNNSAAYFCLDDLADATGRGNTLTNNGTATFNTGKIGNAGYFTAASSQFLSRASGTDLQAGTGSFTIDGWIYITAKSGILCPMVCKFGAAGNLEYSIDYLVSSDRMRFLVTADGTNSTNLSANTFGAFALNTWHYVRAWYDASNSTINISVNNGAADSAAFTGPIFNGTSQFRIGSREVATTQYLDGRIDEVGLWKRALTTADSAARYSGGAGNTYPFNHARPDIFIVAGQSNHGNPGTNAQVFSGAAYAQLLDNAYVYRTLTDPTDVQTNQVDTVSSDAYGGSDLGSYIPLLATAITNATKRPVMFVPCAKGGSLIADWQPGANHQDRTTLYGSCVFRALQAAQVGRLRGVLWWHGESDAAAAISQATYKAGLDTVAAAFLADTGVKMMPCKLQQCSGRDVTNVNLAIADAWATNPNVVTGPDYSDITPSVDGLHFKTDGELAIASSRRFTAIQNAGWV